MSIHDRSDLRVFVTGQKVTFTPEYLALQAEIEKRFKGRVGTVVGYRMGAHEPIVEFPKDGRRKEVKLFEVQNNRLRLHVQN